MKENVERKTFIFLFYWFIDCRVQRRWALCGGFYIQQQQIWGKSGITIGTQITHTHTSMMHSRHWHTNLTVSYACIHLTDTNASLRYKYTHPHSRHLVPNTQSPPLLSMLLRTQTHTNTILAHIHTKFYWQTHTKRQKSTSARVLTCRVFVKRRMCISV